MDPYSLRKLHERLDRIEQRLDRLEGRESPSNPIPAETPPPPPPEAFVTPPPVFELPKVTQPSQTKSPQAFDELQLGGRVLPIVGGAVFLLGIAFLIALGISRGMLTPQVQFFGSLALSVAFVVLGAVKRDEREGFGQVLSAVGSGGLYLTAAGGHVFHGLYGSSVVVISFILLGLANLGYSLGRGSLPFYGLGVAGGLVGAVLPLSEGQCGLHAGLHLLIMATAGAIAWRKAWFAPLALTWLLGGVLALQCFSVAGDHDVTRMLLIGGHTLISAIALAAASRFEAREGEGPVALPAVVLGLGGLAMMFVQPTTALHLGALALAIAAGASTYLMPGSMVRGHVAAAAFCVAAMLAPWGNDARLTAFALAGLGAAAAIVGYRKALDLPSFLSALLVVEGVAAMQVVLHGPQQDFFLRVINAFDRPLALQMSGALAVAAFLACGALSKVRGKTAGSITLGLITPLIGYLAYLTFMPWDVSGVFAIPIGLAFMVIVFSGFVRQTEDPTAVVLAWIVATAGTLIFWTGVLTGREAMLMPSLLLMLVALSSFLAVTYKQGPENMRSASDLLFGFLGGSLIARVLFEIISAQSTLRASVAGTIALTIWLVALMLWAGKRPSSAMIPLVVVYALVTALAHLSALEKQATWLDAALFTVDLVLIAVFSWVMRANGVKPHHAYCISSAIGWLPFFFLGVSILGDLTGAMSHNGATTVTWTIYAAVILAIGFALKESGPRFLALGLFGMTLTKVLLVDLAALDPVIRIAALLLLGLVMIGGGYAYVRFMKRDP